MSVLGIATSSLLSYLTQSENVQSNKQQFKQEFQQLGQDMQSGNLSAAQSDFAILQRNMSQSASTGTAQSSGPISQAFSQLSQDLKSGNISGAQQDYANIQQDFQNQASQSQPTHGHHHHHGGGESNNTDSSTNAISELFSQLGSALKSGNLSNAQQAYSSLQQDLLQVTQASGTSGSSSSGSTATSGVSVNA
jgi:outer membrane protein assembly factor BamD (BamD/ComL family)